MIFRRDLDLEIPPVCLVLFTNTTPAYIPLLGSPNITSPEPCVCITPLIQTSLTSAITGHGIHSLIPAQHRHLNHLLRPLKSLMTNPKHRHRRSLPSSRTRTHTHTRSMHATPLTNTRPRTTHNRRITRPRPQRIEVNMLVESTLLAVQARYARIVQRAEIQHRAEGRRARG